MNARAVAAAPFVVCAALYASVIGGYFLSDDMAVIYVLSEWTERGELWHRVFSKFAAGLDAPSHYYRPLTLLSYALNQQLIQWGPVPWHLINLAGHLAAGVAVYRISLALQPDPVSRAGPALAAALFLLCGTNAEAVAWISGRYDVFATAFALWAAALYLRSRSSFDRFAIGALACGILALTSKESGAILPGLIGCLAWIRHDQGSWRARWIAIARDLAPWLLLIAGYFALRLALFGSMLRVYPGTNPLERIADGGWLQALRAMLPWLSAALPEPPLLATAGAMFLILAAAGLLTAVRNRALRRNATGLLAAILLSLALLLPHVGELSPAGEGGRLFYTTTALLALLLGIPFGALRSGGPPTVASRVLVVVGLALVATQAVLLHAALRDWRIAGTQMGQLISALPRLKESMLPDDYVFVIAPDAIGAAPFARNANGAMVLTPIQDQQLLSSMIIFLPAQISTVPSRLKQQLIPNLKRYTLRDANKIMEGASTGDSAAPIVWPTRVFCWRQDAAVLAVMEMGQTWQDPISWEEEMAQGLRRAGCNNLP